ncbi:hypothetical protein SS50377_25393 [Spironucleus salmonicida]|nr:hypothetical protein SS50377_25393 [Spironucleus salmonicida]
MKHVQLLDLSQPYPFIIQVLNNLISSTIPLSQLIIFLSQIKITKFKLLEFYVFRLFKTLESQYMTTPDVVNRILVEMLSTSAISPRVFQAALRRLNCLFSADFESFLVKITTAVSVRQIASQLCEALTLQPGGFSEIQAIELLRSFHGPNCSLREIQDILKVPERAIFSATDMCEKLFLQLFGEGSGDEFNVNERDIEISARGFWLNDM